MKLIAHRGLLNGPDKQKENSPEQIKLALSMGYDCEIDLYVNNHEMYLGHDEPQYKIDIDFLQTAGLWIHAKNIEALYFLTFQDYPYHYFWHENDQYTLTSKNYIWTYPGRILTDHSVMVLPELHSTDFTMLGQQNCYGVCSDYIIQIKEIFDEDVDSLR